jgi:hypothetical protein
MSNSKHQAQPAKIETFRERDVWIQQVFATDSSALPVAAKIIAAQIAFHLNINSGQCNPSSQRLAKETGLSERHVRRMLAVIERSGLVGIKRSRGHYANSFRLMDPEPGHRSPGYPDIRSPGNPDTNGRQNSVSEASAERESGPGAARGAARASRGAGKKMIPAGGAATRFEDIRAAWPRPWVDDDAADRSAFEEARRHASVEDIITGAAPWAAAMEPRYLPSQAKWLGAKGWQKPPPEKPKQKSRGNGKVDMAKLMLTQEGGFEEDEDGNVFDPAEGRLQ